MATYKWKHVDEQLDIEDDFHSKSVLEGLNKMREDRIECDLIIKAEGKEIPVHRNFMMVVSDYFDAMFSQSTQEKESGIVEMDGVRYPILLKCILYLYTGKLSIRKKECEAMLCVATTMQLTSLCKKIELFLQDLVDLHSFYDMKRIAFEFGLESLNNSCDNVILENFHVLVHEESGVLTALKKDYLVFLLTSSKLHRSVAEDTKLAAIVLWIKGNPGNRKQYLLDLLMFLDLKRVSLKYGRFLAENEAIFLESGELMGLLLLGITERYMVRNSPKPNRLVFFNSTSQCLESFSPTEYSKVIINFFHQTMLQNHFTAVACEGHIFVLMENREFYKVSYKKKGSPWIKLKSMTRNHGLFMRAAVHGRSIYVIGDTLERYSIELDEWEEVETGHVICHHSTIVEYYSDIYVLGGFHEKYLSDVNKLSPKSLTWSPVTPMPEGIEFPTATVFLKKIFVAGGSGEFHEEFLSEAGFYDRQTDSWTRITPMNHRRYGFGLCSVSNKLYAVGRSGYLDELAVEGYDHESNEWTEVINKPEVKVMPSATLSVYFIG